MNNQLVFTLHRQSEFPALGMIHENSSCRFSSATGRLVNDVEATSNVQGLRNLEQADREIGKAGNNPDICDEPIKTHRSSRPTPETLRLDPRCRVR